MLKHNMRVFAQIGMVLLMLSNLLVLPNLVVGQEITSDQLRQLQMELKALGLYNGQVDGVYGPETERALRRLRELNSSSATEVSLSSSSTPIPPDQIIRAFQTQLKALGLFDGQVDGVYGPKTERALRRFKQELESTRPGGCPESPPCPPIEKPLTNQGGRKG